MLDLNRIDDIKNLIKCFFSMKKKTVGKCLISSILNNFWSNPRSQMFSETFGVHSYRFPGSRSVQKCLRTDLSTKNMNFRCKNDRCQIGDSGITILMKINGSGFSLGAQRSSSEMSWKHHFWTCKRIPDHPGSSRSRNWWKSLNVLYPLQVL